MTARFRWFPHDGHRHAVPNALKPLCDGKTLCGEDVTAPASPPPKVPNWCWPECPACDVAWRTAEHLPLRPTLPTPRTEDTHKRISRTSTTGAPRR